MTERFGGRTVEQGLPVPVSCCPWSELSERDRDFFCGEDYLPLHPHHAAQIGLLAPADAGRLASWAFSAIPPGWPDQIDERFKYEDQLYIADSWNDESRRAEVARWLYDRGIPFRRTVYLRD